MRHAPLRIVCLLASAALAGACAAAADAGSDGPAAPGMTQAERVKRQALAFGRERLEDARTLLLGPERPEPAVVTSTDCAALYYQRVALTHERLDYGDTFWDDPRNRAAVFIGATWTPAFYFLAWSALDEYASAAPRPQTQADIDAMRAASARLRCFER